MAVTQLGQGAQNQAPQRKEKQQGSGFTNIQKVLDANEGNKLGSTVAGGLQQAGQNVQQSVERAKDRFGKQLEQGSLGQQQAEERKSLIDKAKQGSEITAEDSGRFGRLSSGQYTGPQGLENAQGLQKQASEAESLAKGANTQSGRYGLLQQFVGTPKYTQGTLRTDSLLLGQQAPELRQAASQVKGVTRGVDQASMAADAQAEQARAQTAGFGEETRQMYEGTNKELLDPVLAAQKVAQERMPVAEQEFQQLINNLPALLKGGTANAEYLGPQDLATLGLDETEVADMQNQFKQLIGTGFSEKQASDIIAGTVDQKLAGVDVLSNVGSFMDENKARQLNALQKLGGQDATEYTNLGGFAAEGIDQRSKSDIEGLANARAKQQGFQNEAQRLNHYVTNFQAANTNAINGTNPGDRAFFAEQNPALPGLYAQYDQLKSSPENTYEKNQALSKLVNKISTEQSRAIDMVRPKLAQASESASQYGNLNSLKAYQDYINATNGGKVQLL